MHEEYEYGKSDLPGTRLLLRLVYRIRRQPMSRVSPRRVPSLEVQGIGWAEGLGSSENQWIEWAEGQGSMEDQGIGWAV